MASSQAPMQRLTTEQRHEGFGRRVLRDHRRRQLFVLSFFSRNLTFVAQLSLSSEIFVNRDENEDQDEDED